MIIHDHFDGSANCVECHGSCKLTGNELALTRFIRYTMEFFALAHQGWMPPEIEKSLAELKGPLDWRRFQKRCMDAAQRLKGLM